MDAITAAVVLTALLCGFIILLAVLDTVVRVVARLLRWYDG